VEEAVGVEVDRAEDDPRAGLDLGGGHDRGEPGPGLDAVALEGGAAVGVLEGLQLDVVDRQPGLGEGLDEEEVRVGAGGRGDGAAGEVAGPVMSLSSPTTSADHSGWE